jgi:hypothetical protein
MILGGGPNRIGQGIEFDYCCVHASFALKEVGCETIMVNCNPETVSTDYDTSDRLYFEPLTFEDVMHIIEEERPDGVIVQFGGQTPLKLAVPLSKAGVPILGTSADAIDRAEDRERFEELLTKLGLQRREGGIATGMQQAFDIAERIGYPVVVRPSYVLGGRAMEICHSPTELRRYFQVALEAIRDADTQTILVDKFLRDAIEVDVDAICDGKLVVIGGVMQHIEEAGIHSGDSSQVLPAHSLPPDVLATIRASTRSAGARDRRHRPDERAVRGARHRRVHHRGEPARVPHGALHLEGHRRAPRAAGRQGHGRRHARRAGLHARDRARVRGREGVGLPVREVPGRGHHPHPRDALHGRGHGHIRRQSLLSNVPLVTTIPGAFAFIEALEAGVGATPRVKSLQEWSPTKG